MKQYLFWDLLGLRFSNNPPYPARRADFAEPFRNCLFRHVDGGDEFLSLLVSPAWPTKFLSESFIYKLRLSIFSKSKLRAKYAYLLNDKDVKCWFDNLATKSIITTIVYLRTLRYFCELNKTNPKELLEVAETKAFRDKFIDFARELERNGKAGSYIARFKKVLRS